MAANEKGKLFNSSHHGVTFPTFTSDCMATHELQRLGDSINQALTDKGLLAVRHDGVPTEALKYPQLSMMVVPDGTPNGDPLHNKVL